jgi:hypothetical protein
MLKIGEKAQIKHKTPWLNNKVGTVSVIMKGSPTLYKLDTDRNFWGESQLKKL